MSTSGYKDGLDALIELSTFMLRLIYILNHRTILITHLYMFDVYLTFQLCIQC